MTFFKQFLAIALSFSLVLLNYPQEANATTLSSMQEDYADLSDNELDALVAPIALYPDALVAQVLGAATFPDQVVDADNFLKSNPNLTGQALQEAAEQQDWDPAVQALTQFPTVLDNLAKNISWTSALGDASATQQEDTLAAVQRMRAQAYAAGNLKSGTEIKVVQQVLRSSSSSLPIHKLSTFPLTIPLLFTALRCYARLQHQHRSCCFRYFFWGWHRRWHGHQQQLLRLWLLGMGHELGVSTISCGGYRYYGNPYWWGGYHPGYRPGYRPPYYPPPRPPRPPGHGRRPTPVNREDRRTYDHLVVNLPLEEGPRALVRQEPIHLQEDVHLLQENPAPERRHLHARVLAIQ